MANEQIIRQEIEACARYLELPLNIASVQLGQWRMLPQALRGAYVLFDPDRIPNVIYVGSGRLRARLETHWGKAIRGERSDVVHPKAWQALRRQHVCEPSAWRVLFFELSGETLEYAMEALLIYRLQPLTNRQSFRDWHSHRLAMC